MAAAQDWPEAERGFGARCQADWGLLGDCQRLAEAESEAGAVRAGAPAREALCQEAGRLDSMQQAAEHEPRLQAAWQARVPGQNNHCRDLVLKTQAWAEAEAACGHSLAASDLLRQFRLLLANAIDTAKAAQAEAEPTEAAKAQLQHFLKKKARLDESCKARLGQARYLTARTSLLTAAAQLIDRSSMQQPGTAYSSSIQQQTADSSILNHITAWLPGPATSTRPRTCRLS